MKKFENILGIFLRILRELFENFLANLRKIMHKTHQNLKKIFEMFQEFSENCRLTLNLKNSE